MKKFSVNLKSYFDRTDKVFWFISISISIYSLLLLLSVSRNSNFSYFKTQLVSVIVGYIGAYLITKSDYRVIANYWYIVAGICLFLIVCTFVFGTSVTGNSGVDAKAWIKLPGGVTFQPSELAKIGFIITFSKHLSEVKDKDELKSIKQLAFLGMHAIVPIALTHLQGDDGAAIIFSFMFLFMAFAAGVQLRYFVGLFVAGVVSIPFLWNYVLADYQKQRLLSQLNPESDPLGIGFQQSQGKLSIGSGKIFGQGLFHGPRVGYGSVPIQQSDFIFSVAGEELGFIGCIIIVLLLLAMFLRTLKIAFDSSDNMGSYMCFGFLGMVVSQTVFNLGMCLGLLPVIGVTLPFFSAGGSSAACLYLGLGLVQSVYMQRYDDNLAHREKHE
ncbi:MAG: Peptidoglycan glycosyltransferase MrdB [Eubacteriales bacterium SKADARSKE-1]|nr:Peptidoglycan glycosyltransferase MrdB [Eubacteriales bacterium SKADARSKE-1]